MATVVHGRTFTQVPLDRPPRFFQKDDGSTGMAIDIPQMRVAPMLGEMPTRARNRDVMQVPNKSLLALHPGYDKVQRVSEDGRVDGMADKHSAALVEEIFKLGLQLRDHGDFAEAVLLLKQAVEGFKMVLGKGHQATLAALSTLGGVQQDADQSTDAIATFSEVLQGATRHSGRVSLAAAGARNNLATAKFAAGSPEEALQLYEEARSIALELEGPNGENSCIITCNYAACLKLLERAPEAMQILLPAYTTLLGLYGPNNRLVASAAIVVGLVMEELGRPDEAKPMVAAAEQFLRTTYGAQHGSTKRCKQLLDRILKGDIQEATNRRCKYFQGEYAFLKDRPQDPQQE
mmetsp:Transcript_45196/g.104756  ORF Transcript_45196/g.104756 Transcript_45196/m.104756 type:complete len:348 (+) Transcript_45196:81-1124(+)